MPSEVSRRRLKDPSQQIYASSVWAQGRSKENQVHTCCASSLSPCLPFLCRHLLCTIVRSSCQGIRSAGPATQSYQAILASHLVRPSCQAILCQAIMSSHFGKPSCQTVRSSQDILTSHILFSYLVKTPCQNILASHLGRSSCQTVLSSRPAKPSCQAIRPKHFSVLFVGLPWPASLTSQLPSRHPVTISPYVRHPDSPLLLGFRG